MSNTFGVNNTIISGSNIINSAKLSIFNANLLNGTVIGSLTGANSGDQLTWDNTNYEWVPLTSNILDITGPTGYSMTGTIGDIGNIGITGYSTTGPIGLTGVTGVTGFAGIGLTGPTGPNGTSGPLNFLQLTFANDFVSNYNIKQCMTGWIETPGSNVPFIQANGQFTLEAEKLYYIMYTPVGVANRSTGTNPMHYSITNDFTTFTPSVPSGTLYGSNMQLDINSSGGNFSCIFKAPVTSNYCLTTINDITTYNSLVAGITSLIIFKIS